MSLFLAENEQANGLYNVGCGQARSWMDLAQAIFAALGKDPAVTFVDMPETIRDKYQYFTEATIDKLRTCGYADELFSLEDAVRDYASSYLVPDRRLGA